MFSSVIDSFNNTLSQLGSWVQRKKERKMKQDKPTKKELLFGKEAPKLKPVQKIEKQEKITPRKVMKLELDELSSPSNSIICSLNKKKPQFLKEKVETKILKVEPKILFTTPHKVKKTEDTKKKNEDTILPVEIKKDFNFIFPSFYEEKMVDDLLPKLEILSLREKTKLEKLKNKTSTKPQELVYDQILKEIIQEKLKKLIKVKSQIFTVRMS